MGENYFRQKLHQKSMQKLEEAYDELVENLPTLDNINKDLADELMIVVNRVEQVKNDITRLKKGQFQFLAMKDRLDEWSQRTDAILAGIEGENLRENAENRRVRVHNLFLEINDMEFEFNEATRFHGVLNFSTQKIESEIQELKEKVEELLDEYNAVTEKSKGSP